MAGFDGSILCVSHDRYFLEKVAGRLLILQPPNMVDFGDRYSAWVEKLAEQAEENPPMRRAAARRKHRRPRIDAPEASAARDARKKDNPYLRPFGRLTLEELEAQITDTEISIAECQENFGDAGSFKDPNRGRKLQEEYESLSKKLEQLEAEYFAREQ